MRRWRRLFGMAVSLCMLCLLTVPGLAAEEKEPYTYQIRFFSGQQGTLNGEDVVVFDNLHYGDQITFNRNSVSLKNGSKYYFKGIRRSGEDINTVGKLTFTVTEDQDYVVAYGILGNTAAYTVNYVDGEGNPLAESVTYYGNVGDKPVVAYLYIDGYRPEAYNLTRTLSANAAENEFTFVYTPVPALEQPAAPTPETPAEPEEPAPAGPTEVATVIPEENVPLGPGPGGANGQDGEGENTQNIDDEKVPQAAGTEEIRDLDDEEVPLAGRLFDSNAKLLGIPIPVILISGAAILGVALWYFLLFRKRRKKEAK